MRIVCGLDYSSDEVAVFDPEKVIARLRSDFPEADVDPTDQSAAEVERVRQFAKSHLDSDSEVQSTVLRQIQGKARRNGPVYSFELAGVTGTAGRYSISFVSDVEIEPSLRQRIVTFLESLKLGSVTVK
jgi:hypothetical protein